MQTKEVTHPKQNMWQRFLHIPTFYKILLANSAIVGLGAVAGTMITVWHVRNFPHDIHYELIGFFAIFGILINFFVNRWVLRRALSPLDRLQAAVNRVREGKTNVMVQLGSVSDEQLDRLAETFNQMLLEHEQHARQMQQLPRQILKAQEEERHRLARELHDEAAQALTSLLVRLRLLERAQNPEQAQKQVQELRQLTAQALEEVRRVALDLRPTILDDLGLGPALEWRIDEFIEANGIKAAIKIDALQQRLPRDLELALYRVGQESLSNVTRHAQAHHVSLSLWRDDSTICLEISDDGVGFNPNNLDSNSSAGLGLLGMRERMAMINGTLTIESTPGYGTKITARAPLESFLIGDNCV